VADYGIFQDGDSASRNSFCQTVALQDRAAEAYFEEVKYFSINRSTSSHHAFDSASEQG